MNRTHFVAAKASDAPAVINYSFPAGNVDCVPGAALGAFAAANTFFAYNRLWRCDLLCRRPEEFGNS